MLKLKEVRESRGYTQDEIADFLGVSRPTYTRYEQGTRECSFETLSKLADFFSVSTDYLLGRNEITKESSDPEIAKLLRENGIEKIELVKDLSIDELKMLIEIGKTIRNKKPEN